MTDLDSDKKDHLDSKQDELKPRPGLKVTVTVDGRRTEGQLLNPVYAGYPNGLWWVLFDGGAAGAFKPEGMEAVE